MKTTKNSNRGKRALLVGVPASPGYALGKVFSFTNHEFKISKERIPELGVKSERSFFQRALTTAMRDLTLLKAKTKSDVGLDESRIFDAHMMILQDPALVDPVENLIVNKLYRAQYAFHEVMNKQIAMFENISEEFAREKSLDLKDVYNRLMVQLSDAYSVTDLNQLDGPMILTGSTLSPSQLIDMRNKTVLGFATDSGASV